jgi:hypothetical protein
MKTNNKNQIQAENESDVKITIDEFNSYNISDMVKSLAYKLIKIQGYYTCVYNNKKIYVTN